MGGRFQGELLKGEGDFPKEGSEFLVLGLKGMDFPAKENLFGEEISVCLI